MRRTTLLQFTALLFVHIHCGGHRDCNARPHGHSVARHGIDVGKGVRDGTECTFPRSVPLGVFRQMAQRSNRLYCLHFFCLHHLRKLLRKRHTTGVSYAPGRV